MRVEEIVREGKSVEEIITSLKKKSVNVPKWGALVKEYDTAQHAIVEDKRLRPDKVLENGTIEPVARVTYGMQKIASRRMTQMSFSIPVKRVYSTDNTPEKEEQAKAIEAIYKMARIDSENIKRMHAYFASCEIATIWYVVKSKHNAYGFPCDYKLRCRSYSPMDEKFSRIEQAELYPLFDKHRDMVAMSFAYSHDVDGEKINYFETYTDTHHYLWKEVDGKWDIIIDGEPIIILKHPLIYLWRTQPIWENSTNNTQEIELTLSRESDIIRKNSAPVLAIKGKLMGNLPSGDKAREVYQLEGDGNIEYVTWQQQIEAMKYYISTLKQNMEEELQLPNLSMENVKSLGVISGEARKTLLTDAHLKVGDESGDIIEFLDRECNVIKAFIGLMNTKWKDSINSLDVEHIITPFVQNDESAEIDKIIKATGGKQIASQLEGIKRLGWTTDFKSEADRIQKEEERERSFSVFEPTTV